MSDKIRAPLKRRRVVIVDDSRTIQAMLDNAFSKRPEFEVVGFSSNAAMAVEMIRRLMPDMVTVDLNMPYIDGAALLQSIDDLKTVCKIVVSDAPLKNLALASSLRQAGAALCLGKTELTANPDKFFAKINAAAEETGKISKRTPTAVDRLRKASVVTAYALPESRAKYFPVPADEQERLQFVLRNDLANCKRERQFDLVTRHVAKATGFPVSLLTFMDQHTQWMKSASGLEVNHTPREEAFCNYTIAQEGTFLVADAASDHRFAHFPSVIGSPAIRCYAGYPVTTSDGLNVGALCLIDNRVRTVSKHVLDQLAGMADIVSEMINQRMPSIS